jgi:hypothetical protein
MLTKIRPDEPLPPRTPAPRFRPPATAEGVLAAYLIVCGWCGTPDDVAEVGCCVEAPVFVCEDCRPEHDRDCAGHQALELQDAR